MKPQLIILFLTLTLCNCTKSHNESFNELERIEDNGPGLSGPTLAYLNEAWVTRDSGPVLVVNTVKTDGVKSDANFSMLARSYQDKSVCCLVYNKNHGIKSSFCKNEINVTKYDTGEILVYGVTLDKYNVQVSTYNDDYEPNCNLYRP